MIKCEICNKVTATLNNPLVHCNVRLNLYAHNDCLFSTKKKKLKELKLI